MTTFGFSAFLKLVNSRVRPQRTQLRGRLRPTGSGYDFHKATRSLAREFLVGGISVEQALLNASAITRPAEEASATAAIKQLWAWRRGQAGDIFSVEDRVFQSSGPSFKVRFSPDFGILIGSERVAVHLWNTKRPTLERRMVLAALALFSGLYSSDEVNDLAVLSLRDGMLYRLGDPTPHLVLAQNMVKALDGAYEELRREGDRPVTDEGPSPTPPAPLA